MTLPATAMRRKIIAPALCLACALVAAALLLPAPAASGPVPVEHGSAAAFPLGGKLACVSYSGIDVLSESGELLCSAELPVDVPLCASGGETLLAVSEGAACLISSDGELRELRGEGGILCTAAAGRYSAVAREAELYSCAVTFYSDGEPLFRRYITSGECRAVAVTEDGQACLLLDGGELLFLEADAEAARASLPGCRAVYAIDGGFCAETDGAAVFFSRSGEKLGEYGGAYSELRICGGEAYACSAYSIVRLTRSGEAASEARFDIPAPRFGRGELPSAVFAGKTTVFGRDGGEIFSFETEYIPENVVTYKDSAAAVWQDAVEIHRK